MVKVYAVRNRTSSDTYVGTTELPLDVRLRLHRSNPNKCSCVSILTCPTAYIELLEECDEEVRKERERWWIENTPDCVNQNNPAPTAEDKARQKREASRRYRAAHREKIAEANRAFREANPDYLRNWRQMRSLNR